MIDGSSAGNAKKGESRPMGPPKDEVRAAAGANLAAVELKFARAEADGLGGGVELRELGVVVGPRGAGRNIDLEHAGVVREADGGQRGVGGWRVEGVRLPREHDGRLRSP